MILSTRIREKKSMSSLTYTYDAFERGVGCVFFSILFLEVSPNRTLTMATKNELATITVQCIPDNNYIIAGVLNSKKARFDIETKSNDLAGQRTPLNIALILDRSGSMESDNKLTFAKRAVCAAISRRSPWTGPSGSDTAAFGVANCSFAVRWTYL